MFLDPLSPLHAETFLEVAPLWLSASFTTASRGWAGGANKIIGHDGAFRERGQGGQGRSTSVSLCVCVFSPFQTRVIVTQPTEVEGPELDYPNWVPQ